MTNDIELKTITDEIQDEDEEFDIEGADFFAPDEDEIEAASEVNDILKTLDAQCELLK